MLTALALLTCAGMQAQNLNPTVEVTNAYQGKLLEAAKPALEMAVPDSLLRFDLDFDYSVFENPYKGAGDFKPYLMDIRPEQAASRVRKFYLRAGAGFPLHPDLDVLFYPVMKDRFSLGFYGSHHSYLGRYRNIALTPKGDVYSLVRRSRAEDRYTDLSDKWHKGYDMSTRAGLALSTDWATGGLKAEVGYRGIHTKDTLATTGLNLVEINANIFSNCDAANYFYYDASISLHSGAERIGGALAQKDPFYTESLGINDFELSGSFGPVFGRVNRVLVDVYAGFHSYGTMFKAQSGMFYALPKYIFDKGRWRLSLGAKTAFTFRSKDPVLGYQQNGRRSQFIYPDVHVGFELVPDYLNVSLHATGGDTPYHYTAMKENHHFFNPTFGAAGPFMDNTVERINASLGLEGNIATKFRYDFRGGFAAYKNGLMDYVSMTSVVGEGYPAGLRGSVSFGDYNLVYADLKFMWDSPSFTIDGLVSYKHTNILKKELKGFEPAPLSGTVRGRYNWRNRLYAGAYVEFAAARRGTLFLTSSVSPAVMRIPGYVCPGLTAEYKMSRRLSVWAQADNLLNMTIQRHPLYPDSGLGFRLGVCVNL